MLNGIFFVLRTGCQWKALDKTNICSGSTAYARLQRAQQLLITSDLTVHEIARRTGYLDAIHFSRAFKRRYGTSPQNYRNRC